MVLFRDETGPRMDIRLLIIWLWLGALTLVTWYILYLHLQTDPQSLILK